MQLNMLLMSFFNPQTHVKITRPFLSHAWILKSLGLV